MTDAAAASSMHEPHIEEEEEAYVSSHVVHEGLYLGLPPVVMTASDLPEEVLSFVFAFLDRRSLLAAAAACHRWNRIASDDALWRSLYFRHYHSPETVVVDADDAGDDHASSAIDDAHEDDAASNSNHHGDGDGDAEFGRVRSWSSELYADLAARRRFMHASSHSWRAADACRRASDDALRTLLAQRDYEAEAMRIQLKRAEEDIAALATCCEGLESEQAMRLEAELALRAARAELEDASYELMGRTHHLEEKTEEAAQLARALLVAEKGREDEKRRADELEREAKALRERCEAAERSLELSTQRWAKEKKKRKELLDLLAREQRSRSELTRETLATMLKQLLGPSAASSQTVASLSRSSAAQAPASQGLQASSSSSSSIPSSSPPVASILSASPPLPPPLASLLHRRRAGDPIAGSSMPAASTPASKNQPMGAAPPANSTSPPKSSLYLPLKGQAKCNF